MLIKLNVGPSPHIRNNMRTKIILADFLIGLSPVLLTSLFVYKENFLILFLFSILAAIFIDKVFTKLFNLPDEEYAISSIITAVLLMLTFPINIPLWVLFFGICFALIIGKFIFGGLGQNLFNPALLGRVFLMASFPQYAYNYTNNDGLGGATVLTFLKHGGEISNVLPSVQNLVLKINEFNSIGETSIIALLFGYLYLTVRKRIDGKIPLIMVLTVFAGSFLMGKNGFYSVVSGGVIFGAVYFLTDPVSSPYTKGGKKAYAIFVGILTVLIREFTSHPEGVAYAVLFGNMFTPLFNKLFAPRVFGRKKDMKEFFNLIKILLFTVIAIFLLNLLDKNYLKKIEIQKDQILIKEMKEIVPLGYKFDIYENSQQYEGFLFVPVYNKEGEKIAYVVKGKSRGYSEKEMEFLLGLDLKGKTLGHKIIAHQETLGLGSKISEKEFKKLWFDKDINTKFNKKTDSVTGATYTFLNFFKTVKEVLKIYDEKIINEKTEVKKEIKTVGVKTEKTVEGSEITASGTTESAVVEDMKAEKTEEIKTGTEESGNVEGINATETKVQKGDK